MRKKKPRQSDCICCSLGDLGSDNSSGFSIAFPWVSFWHPKVKKHTHTYIHTCIHTYICICTKKIYMYIYICIYVDIYVCIHICMYTYIYRCISSPSTARQGRHSQDTAVEWQLCYWKAHICSQLSWMLRPKCCGLRRSIQHGCSHRSSLPHITWQAFSPVSVVWMPVASQKVPWRFFSNSIKVMLCAGTNW